MNRSTAAIFWAYGAMVLLMAAPVAAQAQFLNLAPVGLSAYDGVDIGDTQIGVSSTATTASGSLCTGGPCPRTTVFPSNGIPGTPVFCDVSVFFTLTAGQAYLVEFEVQPGGSCEGLTAEKSVEFYRFDPSLPNDPPFVSGVPFTVGPVRVVDGWFYHAAAKTCVHRRCTSEPRKVSHAK